MIVDVDLQYPYLSDLAKSQGKTLNELGNAGHSDHNEYLKLADCCWFALNDLAIGMNGDHRNYLATLDEFLKRFNCNKWLWKKLYIFTGSSFLDTVLEATWAIYFQDRGLTVELEVPFDKTKSSSKNADLVVNIDGKKWWFDAYSIGAACPVCAESPSTTPYLGLSSLDTVVDRLINRVREKYSEKFKDAIQAGLLDGSSVGILLCVIKREQSVIPQFISKLSGGQEFEPPPSLFDGLHGLDLVWVHTLRPQKGSDVLQPVPLCKWTCNLGNT